jgi:hypothetical protein
MSLCDKIDVLGPNQEGNYSIADFSKVILRLGLHPYQKCGVYDTVVTLALMQLLSVLLESGYGKLYQTQNVIDLIA